MPSECEDRTPVSVFLSSRAVLLVSRKRRLLRGLIGITLVEECVYVSVVRYGVGGRRHGDVRGVRGV